VAKRTAYFILETQRTSDGRLIPLIAIEGERGYHLTDWSWTSDADVARGLAQEKNLMMGISDKEAMRIVGSTMGGV